MANPKDYNPRLHEDEEEGKGEGGSETGEGKSGSGSTEVVFRLHDILATQRDDLLPSSEIKRLLLVEKDLHKAIVTKQKLLIKERKAQKEGVSLYKSYNQDGTGYGRGYDISAYKTHPISSKAQFSGATDKKVVGIPTLNEAETNEENKNKLENNYENKLRHQYTPGNRYTPKLTRQ